MPRKNHRSIGAGSGLILLAATLWGLLGPVARVAYDEGVEPMEVALWRAVLGSVFFGIHAAVRGGRFPRKKDVPGFILFALIGGALFFGSYQMAVDSGGAALASVLLYTAPAWVVAAGAIWLQERITGAKILAVVMTLAGVVLIAGGAENARYSTLAIFWGLLSGVSYASYYVFGKLYFHKYSGASVYAFIFPVAACVLLPFVTFSPKSPAALAAILVIGFVSTYLAYLAYAAGLRRLDASQASILATAEPVVAGVLAHLWWGERFGWSGYLGAGLILSAIVATSLLSERVRKWSRSSAGELVDE